MTVKQVRQELERIKNPAKAVFHQKFFQSFPGGYGEGDRFLGISVPEQRRIARKYFQNMGLDGISELLVHDIHEHRLTALFMLILLFEKSHTGKEKDQIAKFYLRHVDRVNNWDLVDSSAHKILGPWLENSRRDLLYDLVASGKLWRQRIAVICCFYFIKKDDFADILKISEMLLAHEHDLIHKAVGWMLREVGKRNLETEKSFLDRHIQNMPRTMLRYAIEKFPEKTRKLYLQK